MNIRKELSNVLGWRTKRHIIVFESDDWGSIRIHSKKDYADMVSAGLNLDTIFTKYDCLESNDDLERLFEVLSKHKDSTGRACVFTPMSVMANPAFEKIEESGMQHYYYEPFTETCKRYPNHDRVNDLWHEGIEKRLFVPAFHAREHFNVNRWMSNLQSNKGMQIAFKHFSIGVGRYKGELIPEYLGAFYVNHKSEIPEVERIIFDGGKLFEQLCGYKPTHFIAPNRESAMQLDKSFARVGVRYMTMAKLRKSHLGDGDNKKALIWLGKRNPELDQLYITRNGSFEQVDFRHNYVNECLADIAYAFKFCKPCVISSHRVNYIGYIDSHNSSVGLKLLDELLTVIEQVYPDVEYMTSTELGELIRNEKRIII